MYVCIHYAVSLILQITYTFSQSVSGTLSVSEVEENVLNGSYALYVIAAIVSVWIYMLIGVIRKKPLDSVIESQSVPPIIYIMCACLAVGARFLVNIYYVLAQDVEVLRKSIEKAEALSPQFTDSAQMLIALFSIMIAAPIFEEILFRGIIQNELLSFMRPWSAIGLQAVLFGVMHGVLFQSIFTSMVGVFLGIVYYKTQNIKTSAVCHGVFNFSAILTQESINLTSSIIFTIFGILLVACSLFYIFNNCKRN